MECSLYNVERKKKPVTCTPKVWCFPLQITILNAICSHLCTLFTFPSLLFALYRANHLPRAYAPCDLPRQNGSVMPIRPARLKSSALEPEVEIHGTAATPRATWTQTVMGRYDQAFCMRNSNTACSFLDYAFKMSFYSKSFDFVLLLLFVYRQMNMQSKARPLLMERLSGRVKVAPGKCFCLFFTLFSCSHS